MKLTNLPPEGVRILIWGIVGVSILTYFANSRSSIFLRSCEKLSGVKKTQCITRVEANKEQLTKGRLWNY